MLHSSPLQQEKAMEAELPLHDRIEIWKQKAVAGTLSDDEMKQAIAVMRGGRVAASETSAKAKSKAAPIDSDSILDNL
jgi:hypothetical protein